MKKLTLLLLTGCFGMAFGKNAPDGFGQLENAPEIIPGGSDEEGRKYFYNGQPAVEGKIILTASNGFFTNGTCKAEGTSNLPKVGDEELIVPNFAYLDWKRGEGSLRWYLLISKPGTVNINTYLKVSSEANGVQITAKLGGQSKEVTTSKSGENEAQPWDLSFEVTEPGEYQFSLEATKLSNPQTGVGELHRIDVFGSAVDGANLLRVRWRPAAVHGRYDTAKVRDPKLLVFTTRSVCDLSSYSPITTPFGYYGTSFGADRRSNGHFNFSMWGKEGAADNLTLMPHLLGVGSPDGEFSGFGHEGSGVKARGWEPMPDHPELCVQALRVVPEDLYDAYYGYYFDHPTNAWKFYCAGKKWHGGKPMEHLKLGSFCEIPGPPQSERTGDIYREVRRKGWAYDDGKWVPLEQYIPGTKGDEAVCKSWYTTKDGEYAMGCGGIRLYEYDASMVKSVTSGELPYFLTNETIPRLFAMPVEYGDIQELEVASSTATIEVDIPAAEELQSGMIYYGTEDALTFAPRELHGTEKNSALSQSINEQSWKSGVEIENPKTGVNRATLSDLKPDTTYFYRVLMNGVGSRVWNGETMSFKTQAAGEPPVKNAPLTAAPQALSTVGPKAVTDEPFRLWTYQINGTDRKIEGRLTGIAGGKIQIERKADGKKGTMNLQMFSSEDKAYVKALSK